MSSVNIEFFCIFTVFSEITRMPENKNTGYVGPKFLSHEIFCHNICIRTAGKIEKNVEFSAKILQ
jgi:hypothetical protein